MVILFYNFPKINLQKSFDEFRSKDITGKASDSLSSKIKSKKYQITTRVRNDGIYVSLAIVDFDGKLNKIPMTEVIGTSDIIGILGLDEAKTTLDSGNLSEDSLTKIAPHLVKAVIPFEIKFLQLRYIEDILKSFGYDGFAYQNDNEGEGWSYAVFDDSQIVKSETESYTNNNNTRYSLADNGVYSLEDAWAEKTKKYGAIPRGEAAYRDTEVSKKTSSRAFKPSAFTNGIDDTDVSSDKTESDAEAKVEDLYGDETIDDSYFYAEGDKRFVMQRETVWADTPVRTDTPKRVTPTVEALTEAAECPMTLMTVIPWAWVVITPVTERRII